jgi:hypothetical protein
MLNASKLVTSGREKIWSNINEGSTVVLRPYLRPPRFLLDHSLDQICSGIKVARRKTRTSDEVAIVLL